MRGGIKRLIGSVLPALFIATLAFAEESRPAAPTPTAPQLSTKQRQELEGRRQVLLLELKKALDGKKLDQAILRLRDLSSLNRKLFGDEHPETLGTLDLLVKVRDASADFISARQPREELLRLHTRDLGNDHWRVIDERLQLEDCRRLSKFTPEQVRDWYEAIANLDEAKRLRPTEPAKSLPLSKKAGQTFVRLAGEEHWRTALALSAHGYEQLLVGQTGKAEVLLKRALALHEKVVGPNHPHTAANLHRLATLYFEQADGVRSLPLAQRALDIYRHTRGPEDPETIKAMNDVLFSYLRLGDTKNALALAEEALALREKVHGPDHRWVATSLINLSEVHMAQGSYAEARETCERAIAITENLDGPDDQNAMTFRVLLAEICEAAGDSTAALDEYRSSLKHFVRRFGDQHVNTAGRLCSIAGFYARQGDYLAAQPLAERALDLTERYGKKTPKIELQKADCLCCLANIAQSQHRSRQAAELFNRALAIRSETLGKDHPDRAEVLNSLGCLERDAGNFAAALPLLSEALRVREAKRGAEQPETAATLAAIGRLQLLRGDQKAALRQLERALTVCEKIYGSDHPEVSHVLTDLAIAHHLAGDDTAALPLARRAADIARRQMDRTAAIQSERQQWEFQLLLRPALDALLTITIAAHVTPEASYDAMFAWKGATFMRQRWMRALRSELRKDGRSSGLLAELESKTRALANRYVKVDPKATLLAQRVTLERLSKEVEELQQQLAQSSAVVGNDQQSAEGSPAELRTALPAGTALVDMMCYDRLIPARGEKSPVVENRLLAFVIRADRPLRLVDLGPTDRISAGILAWRFEQLKFEVGATEVDEARARLRAWHDAHGKQIRPEEKLREWLWYPLNEHLDGCSTVLLSPDGPLANFPWGALPGGKPGTFLIEELAIAVAPVPQMLLGMLRAPADSRAGAEPALLAVGNVDYFADPVSPAPPSADDPLRRAAAEHSAIAPLPSTDAEITAIGYVFEKTMPRGMEQYFRGIQGTEAAVRETAPQTTVLHLATHGYYNRELLTAREADADAERSQRALGEDAMPMVSSRHPDVLCGLALVGAGREGRYGSDDGFLTALEVKNLNLDKVELVTLSACQTALGTQLSGEGTLSLQRAFQLAGARSTVTTLWSVNSLATRQLMVDFYDNLWSKKMSRVDALRQAQLKLLRGGVREAKELTAGQDRAPPYFWSGFVLAGDWR